MPTMPGIQTRRLKLWPGKSSSNNKEGSINEQQNQQRRSSNEDRTSERQSTENGLSNAEEKEEEARPLAKDIKARRVANERLYNAAEAYHSGLVKKKPLPFDVQQSTSLEALMILDELAENCSSVYPSCSQKVPEAAKGSSSSGVLRNKDKLLPIEAFGMALASSAVTYRKVGKAENSNSPYLNRNETYSSHLGLLAGVHLALGQAQTTFTDSMSVTILNRLARIQASIESLRTAEKACETAREKMEASEKKRDKAREKGENKRELEEEARQARATYEEAFVDVETRVNLFNEAEQEGPGSGVEIVKEYVDLQLQWIQEQHEIMTGVQAALAQFQTKHQPLRTHVNRKLTVGDATNGRKRSTSSPKIPQSNLNFSHSAKSASLSKATSRPASSRGASTNSIPTIGTERPTLANTSGRSDSFTTKADTKSNGNRSRGDSIGGKFGGRLGSVLGRSTSTNDVVKSNLIVKQESGSSNEGKNSVNWTTSLLSRKRDPSSKAYKNVLAGEHERNLSHVREGTDQSWDVSQPHLDVESGVSFGGGLAGSRRESEISNLDDDHEKMYNQTHYKTTANYHHTGDSLAPPQPNSSLTAQWTGFTSASSEGGDPFGGSNEIDTPVSPFIRTNGATH